MSIYTRDIIPQNEWTKIGEWTYGTPTIARSYPDCRLTIGKFCSFGQGITFAFWGRHQIGDISTYPFNCLTPQGWPPVTGTFVSGEDITVGSDVWIANNALILQGATIADGAVIGAHSIVGGHVDAYSVVVGNPSREVKKRFSDEQIDKLLEMKWWNWSIDKIRQHLQVISSSNIDQLFQIWETEIKNG